MRTILIAMATAGGVGLVGASNTLAAPITGVVIDNAVNTESLIDQVHCRWYPHRHRGGIPHGWGRGCGTAPKGAPKKK